MTTIYIELLNEGTFCLRPVNATHIEDDVYQITSTNTDPDDEEWAFNTGDKVRCVMQVFSGGGSGLRAVEKLT